MNEATQGRSERIADQLRNDIIGGLLPPGMPLVEADLTTAYGTSRNTLREALHQLDREGLTHYIRNKGVVVRKLGPDNVRDIYRVRRVIELQAVRERSVLAAIQLERMAAHIEAAQTAFDRENWQQVGTHSLMFHRSIVTSLGSPLLNQFFTTVLAQLRLVFALDPNEARFQRPWLARDRAIYTLLESGHHQEAYDTLALYLDDSEQTVLDALTNGR